MRRRVGYLAQDPRYYEHMTARETLRYTARFFYRGPKDLIEARIEEMLELTGLYDKADRSIKGFSGGERQRLGIAQAQVNYPDLLILDEPTTGISATQKDVLFDSLRKLTAEGKSVVLVSHKLEDVEALCDEVTVLRQGKVTGCMDQPFDARRLLEMMFGTPPPPPVQL